MKRKEKHFVVVKRWKLIQKVKILTRFKKIEKSLRNYIFKNLKRLLILSTKSYHFTTR